MQWSELFEERNQPSFEQINEYVNNPLWQDLHLFLQNTYNIQPKMSYSKCPMLRGWNVKYQKSGKALCTLYPMLGCFIALVVIGNKEIFEAELLIPLCSDYTKTLFNNTVFSAGGKWLMINITDNQILDDAKNLIHIRTKNK